MFLYPDSKACAREYGEGPDAIARPIHERWLEWAGGVGEEAKKIYCPMLERPVVTYYLKDRMQAGVSVTLPFLAEDKKVYYYIFDYNECWIEEPIMVGEYIKGMECWPEDRSKDGL